MFAPLRRFLPSALIVAAAIVAGPAPRADEAQPPAPAPAGLALKFHGTMPQKVDFTRIDGLLAKYLSGTDAEKAAAETALLQAGPVVAYAVEVKGRTETDAAAKDRLAALTKKVLADSVDTARLLFQFAQALATVSKEGGPMKMDDRELPRWRSRAKVFHLCFVNETFYAERLATELTAFVPHLDLAAAADIYRESGLMYYRLSQASQDKEAAAKLAAEAERCRDLAAKAVEEAGKVK